MPAHADPGYTDHLLIARKGGSSLSRRQRTLPADKVGETVSKWRREFFDGFWHFGAIPEDGGPRPLIRQWSIGPEMPGRQEPKGNR